MEDCEHQDSVRLCKINSTFHRRENKMYTSSICRRIVRRDITPLPCFYLNRFYYTTSTRLAKRFPWHVLSKQRPCSPYSRILINTCVGNPTVPVTTPPLSKVNPKRSRTRLLVFSPFIRGPRLVSFLRSSIESTPCPEFQHPEPQIRVLRTFNNVRLRPSGPVDALLRHGGGHIEVT